MTDEQRVLMFVRGLCLSALTILAVGEAVGAEEIPSFLPSRVYPQEQPVLPTDAATKDRASPPQMTTSTPVTQIGPNTPAQALPTPSDRGYPPIEGTSQTPVTKKQGKVLVTIDPGHGGKDSGAIGVDGLREVDVILPIALRVAAILEQQGIATQLTRNSDYFVGLDERVVMSRQAGATLFVSIHANAIDGRPDVKGLETYHYNLGESLAQTVHTTIIDYFNNQQRIPLNDRRVRSARFLVLRKSTIPAILVETGYLTSPEEAAQLGDPKYKDLMAEAIAQGIIKYIQAQP
jgi:N-acetylmuramoyl-L-alanine amidase